MNRSVLDLGFSSLLVGCSLLAIGCRSELPIDFEENLVHAKKWELQSGASMDQVLQDSEWALGRLFGSPDEPKLPDSFGEDEDLKTLVSLENLQSASGSDLDEGRGLYRQHCVRCHGITGNGRGEAAALVEPYPRDFRPGIFKFKSTARGAKPLKSDLTRTIKYGLAGTSMVPEYQLPDGKVGPLPDDVIEKLVDYVIYLSMRGETERALLDQAAMELDLEGGERLIDPSLETSDAEAFQEQLELIEDVVAEIGGSWLDAEDEIVEIEIPSDLPVPASHDELVTMLAGDSGDALRQSIERGRELFVGTIASCSKCHGASGRGDGQEADYDDWTKDWTTRIGLKPDDEAALIPLIARGALPPRTIKPRNFEQGVFRGGDRPQDLYHRLNQGIAGTPMPAVTLVPGQFEEADVWHLINFVRSLKKPEESTKPPAAAATALSEAADNQDAVTLTH